MSELVILEPGTTLPELAVQINVEHEQAATAFRSSVEHAYRAGALLEQAKREVRKTLGPGQWLSWLEANCPNVSGRTARLYKRIFKKINGLEGETASLADLASKSLENLDRAFRESAIAEYVNGGECRTDAVENLAALADSGWQASTIYADPPWTFKVYSGAGKSRSAENHYNTMGQASIEALGDHVMKLAADNCALFLWAVMPQLPEALRIIEAWGFTYKTVGFTWVKRTKSSNGFHVGMGYWTRANAELCLLATKGSPKRQAKDVEQLVIAPVGRHSSKPSIVQDRIERLVGGPYLELFGRRRRHNWVVWGNEVADDLFDQSKELDDDERIERQRELSGADGTSGL